MIFWTMRSLALRLRGFFSISAGVGSIGFLVYFPSTAGVISRPVISSTTPRKYGANRFLTIRSSIEWNVITANIPPIASLSIVFLREVSICSNSLLTAIRKAWKTLFGECLSKLADSIIRKRSNVVQISLVFRASTIARAMKTAFFSSA